MSESVEIFGACRFCGQVNAKPFFDISREEADMEATKNCRCNDACIFRERQRQKDEAKINIHEIFADSSERWNSVDDERIITLMEYAVDLVGDYKVRSLQLSIPGGGTAKICLNSKDGIVVERRKTDHETEISSR